MSGGARKNADSQVIAGLAAGGTVAAVAKAANVSEAPTLAHDPNGLRGLVLDVTIANSGAVLDATAHVSRKYVFRPDPASRVPMPGPDGGV